MKLSKMLNQLTVIFFGLTFGITINTANAQTFNYLTNGKYDVVVVGAGTSGIAAAIQAARMGANVALLEPTDWVGGQATAAGVTSMDQGGYIPLTGIYGEFINQVKQYYSNSGLSISTCYWSNTTFCFEPRIGQQIFLQMLSKAGVHLFLRTNVTGVIEQGNTVTAISAQQSMTANQLPVYIFSSVLIDATEYGDLLPLAHIPYRVGNSISPNINPAACVQNITYTAVMKDYPFGVPISLRADLIGPPPGYTTTVSNKFATYLALNGYPKWNGGAYPNPNAYPVSWATQNAYRGMPNSNAIPLVSYTGLNQNLITRTGLNWANDSPYSADAIENPLARQQQNCNAKLETIQFIYYIQHDLGMQNWAIANDEGYNTPYNIQANSCPNIPVQYKAIEQNMPVIPYIRESRRMIGLATLTGKNVYRTNGVDAAYFPSAVAVGDYGDDLHGCNTDNPPTFEAALGETSADMSPSAGRFQIPFEALIPQTMDGFLAAEKNISQSRMANGATRLQPSTMYIGQAAGAIAAYAVKNNIQPRNVNPEVIQSILADAGQPVSLYDFTDVPAGTTYWGPAQVTSASEIMIGYGGGIFGPDNFLTRGQVALALERKFSFPASYNGNRNVIPAPAAADFADVPTTSVYFAAVEKMYNDGITNGCQASPQRLFCPDLFIPNYQMAVFGARLMKLDLNAYTSISFTDEPMSDPYYKYLNAMVGAGLMDAPGGSVSPYQNITRGAFAKIIEKMNSLGTSPVWSQ